MDLYQDVCLIHQDEFPALKERMEEEAVLDLVRAYLAACAVDKRVITEHDQAQCQSPQTSDMTILETHWKRMSLLRRKATRSRIERKRLWRHLIDFLETEWAYTSSDEEDRLE